MGKQKRSIVRTSGTSARDLLDFKRTPSDSDEYRGVRQSAPRPRQKGKRCYFDDEEPEREYVTVGWHDACGHCGHEGHESDTCPERSVFERLV